MLDVENRVYYSFTKTQARYDAIETKDDHTLYFVLDSQRLYKGGVDVTQGIIFVDGFSPTPGPGVFDNKLYINKSTLEARIAHDGNWFKIVPTRVTTAEEIEDEQNQDSFTTSSAIREFVSNKFDEYKLSSDHLKDIDYDPITGTMQFTFGDESSKNIQLQHVVHDATFNADTCILTIPQYGSQDIELDFSVFDGLVNVRYESDYEFEDHGIGPAIIFTVAHYGGLNTDIVLDASPFIQVYKEGKTDSIDIQISDDLEITGNVIISDEPNNALQSTRKGLFIDISSKADVLRGDVANHVLIADANGNIADSGMTIATGSVVEDSSTTIPTSAQVYESIQEATQGQIIPEGNPDEIILSTEKGIKRSGKTIGGTTLSDIASGDVLATEAAVIDAISWKSIRNS